jgi:hypothetical protein
VLAGAAGAVEGAIRGARGRVAPRLRCQLRDRAARAGLQEPPALPRKGAPRPAPPPTCLPPPSLPYKVDTSRPSLRTNWTRLVPTCLPGRAASEGSRRLTALGEFVKRQRQVSEGSLNESVGARQACELLEEGLRLCESVTPAAQQATPPHLLPPESGGPAPAPRAAHNPLPTPSASRSGSRSSLRGAPRWAPARAPTEPPTFCAPRHSPPAPVAPGPPRRHPLPRGATACRQFRRRRPSRASCLAGA